MNYEVQLTSIMLIFILLGTLLVILFFVLTYCFYTFVPVTDNIYIAPDGAECKELYRNFGNAFKETTYDLKDCNNGLGYHNLTSYIQKEGVE